VSRQFVEDHWGFFRLTAGALRRRRKLHCFARRRKAEATDFVSNPARRWSDGCERFWSLRLTVVASMPYQMIATGMALAPATRWL